LGAYKSQKYFCLILNESGLGKASSFLVMEFFSEDFLLFFNAIQDNASCWDISEKEVVFLTDRDVFIKLLHTIHQQ